MIIAQVIIFLVLLVLSASIVAFSKSLLRSVVALGACSFFLAVIFFLYEANVAAIFELSVGAGLMSVLMIIAISLVDSIRQSKKQSHEEPK